MASQPSPPPATVPPPAWKTFPFFESTNIHSATDLAASPAIFSSPQSIAVICPASIEGGRLLIADSEGGINVVDREFEVKRRWTAYPDGRCTHLMEAKGIAVTLGEEPSTPYALLKIWDLLRIDKKTRAPVLLRSAKVQHGGRPHPVSSAALTPTLSYLAIGLGDGTVLLYRHLSTSLSPSASATSLPKPKILLDSSMDPITGISFRVAGNDTHLFVVTIGKVLVAQVGGKKSGGDLRSLDDVGGGLGCVAEVEGLQAGETVAVAREEAVYLYGTETRGNVLAYEGPKSAIYASRNNLIIVSPPFLPTAYSNSQTVRNLARNQPAQSQPTDIARLAIIDLDNKFVSYSGTFREGVRDVFCLWNAIFVLGNDGKLSRLDEAPLSAKLSHLFSRSYFVIALNLAKSEDADRGVVADIHRRYGDFLYSKGDYDGAVGQYVKTLGELQPSYVIRKFLDAQRIHNLTTYLQELHASALASSDHTTLLLNCYTKTGDVARLDSFIRTTDSHASKGELPFDLETAIKVCRQAGFYEQAVFMAHKYSRHEEYLSIQIEDANDWADALRYMRTLGPEAAEENMIRYGKTLLAHQPSETTDLLIALCSGTLTSRPAAPTSTDTTIAANSSVLNSASTLASTPAYLAVFKESLSYGRTAVEAAAAATVAIGGAFPPINGPSSSSKNGAGPALSSTSREEGESSPDASVPTAPEENGKIAPVVPTYNPPSPRPYFAHFVNQPEHLLRFLEAIALARWGQKVDVSKKASGPKVSAAPPPTYDTIPSAAGEDISDDKADKADQRAVWNTLLELYLLFSSRLGPASTESNRLKALRLIQQSDTIPYDTTQALILCSTNNFTEGLVEIWEKLGMYEDVLRFWMEKENEGGSVGEGEKTGRRPSDELLAHLEIYGPTHPHLYPLVLRFLTSSNELLTRHPADLKRILEIIEEENLMPTLQVVQVLSRNGVASVGIVKDWLREKVLAMRLEVDSDRALINSYRTETAAKQREVAALTDTSKPQIFQVRRCASCGTQLELPAVHFMCKHSYHQRCLPDADPDCPLCAHQHGLVREIRANNAREKDQHEAFLGEVRESEDGFSVVAGGFGRGMMDWDVEATDK